MHLKLITSFLKNRFQRVVLNDQTCEWRLPTQASVPRRSIFGALLFLIFINDDDRSLLFTSNLFADDTSFFSVVNKQNINNDLELISSWG